MAKGRDDLRLALGWVDHLKTRRLIDEVGERGALCLLRLWAYAAQNHPDGTFASTDDVEPAAGWRGRRGVLLSALIRLRWLEEDGVTLHDWREEQPWIAGKARRVASAKANAEARWNRKRDAEPTIPQCGSHSGTDADSMRTAENGNAPSPIPTPTPIPTPSPTRSPERAREPDPEQSPAGTGYATTHQSPQVEPPTGRSPRHLDGDPPVPAPSTKRTAMDATETAAPGIDPAIASLVELWNEVTAGSTLACVRIAPKGSGRALVLRDALRAYPDLKSWRGAFCAVLASPHHIGKNDRGWTASIDFVCRKSERDKWIDAGLRMTTAEVDSDPRCACGGVAQKSDPKQRCARCLTMALQGVSA